MGIAVSNTRRALRNWNATNRAIKYLDKTAAKRQTTPSRLNIEESYKELDKSLYEKNIALEQRVMGFDIKSEGVKKSILPEEFDYVPKSTRKLPKRIEIGNPIPPPYVELGFAIPECIPKGKITLKQAINMIKSYQLKDKSVEQLAVDYDLDVQMVASICKYFALFVCEGAKVWVPPTKSDKEKVLLDTPVYQEDDRIADDGVSRYIRLHELDSPSK